MILKSYNSGQNLFDEKLTHVSFLLGPVRLQGSHFIKKLDCCKTRT